MPSACQFCVSGYGRNSPLCERTAITETSRSERDEGFEDQRRAAERSPRRVGVGRRAQHGLALAVVAEPARLQHGRQTDRRDRAREILATVDRGECGRVEAESRGTGSFPPAGPARSRARADSGTRACARSASARFRRARFRNRTWRRRRGARTPRAHRNRASRRAAAARPGRRTHRLRCRRRGSAGRAAHPRLRACARAGRRPEFLSWTCAEPLHDHEVLTQPAKCDIPPLPLAGEGWGEGKARSKHAPIRLRHLPPLRGRRERKGAFDAAASARSKPALIRRRAGPDFRAHPATARRETARAASRRRHPSSPGLPQRTAPR